MKSPHSVTLDKDIGKNSNPHIFDKLPYFGNSQFRIAYSRVLL